MPNLVISPKISLIIRIIGNYQQSDKLRALRQCEISRCIFKLALPSRPRIHRLLHRDWVHRRHRQRPLGPAAPGSARAARSNSCGDRSRNGNVVDQVGLQKEKKER